ncbi:hypothetical protein [Blastopirellula marina]|uniref:Uncharacterized protein n=1 Tax=Blastopirellula marina TaxID=124 RepID=A0A2S8GK50_9BACT|nr:hypothetical protein [Blastopirellula marina]PQO44760.1 hypothetical protein C5Y93_16805 [Blastopirellula marina]
MDNREEIQQQMLELIYGLLSDDESAELVERISSDGELARAYAELKEKTELLAEVTKAEAPQPDYAAWKKEADRKHPASPRTAGSSWTVRTWQVVSALAACLLIGALAYPPLAIDTEQQTTAFAETSDQLANDFLSLSITGPSLMAAEVRNEFFVSVENAANQPVDAQVEYWFKSPNNETVYYGQTESKDGQVVCQIPADEVSSAARLEVVAQRGDVQSTLGLDVQAAPPKPVAVLQTDRDVAEPGQTVNFRAVVLDPQNQQTRSANVDFVWSMQDFRGINRIASAERSTLKGVALGQLQVPPQESADQLELAVESPELQNRIEQRNLPLAGKLAASETNAAGRTEAMTAPATPALSQLSAKPEGGSLVAGVQNRLLYLSQNNANAPATPMRAQLRSANIEDAMGNGIPATEQLVQEIDFGTFDVVPEASQQYTLEVANDGEPPLEQQSFEAKQLPATFQINNGVAPSNEPLDIDVRVAIPNTTMALVAGDAYSTIGYHLWDAGVNAPITQPVQLDLPTEATGAQLVRLFSVPSAEEQANSQKPQLLAERVIYRIPVQRFNIDLQGLPAQASPGQQISLQMAVKDEYANAAQATLGIQMQRVPDVLPGPQEPLGLEGEFLLNQRVSLPQSLVRLPDDVRLLEKDRVYFDQVLALSDWRKQAAPQDDMLLMARLPEPGSVELAEGDSTSANQLAAEELPVMRRSNKQSVRSKYEQAIAAVQQQWQDRMEDVRQTSRTMLIVGGAILGVGLLGLALAQGRRKVAIWGPGLAVALGSILWGIFSANLTLEQFSGPATGDGRMVAVSEEAELAQKAIDDAPTAERSVLSNAAPAEDLAGSADLYSEAETLAQQSNNLPAKPQVKLRTNNSTLEEKASTAFNRTDRSRFFRGLETSGQDGLASSGIADGGYGGALKAAGMAESNVPTPLRSRAATPPLDVLDLERSAAEASPAPFAPRAAGEENASPQSLLWQPRLSTNSDGQVALSVTLPTQPGRYRLVIDAHGSGRLGTIVRYVEIAPPQAAEPVE